MPTVDVEKRRAKHRRHYERHREKVKARVAERRKSLTTADKRKYRQAQRARWVAAGLTTNGAPRKVQETKPKVVKPPKEVKPWHGLSDSEAYRVRYRLDEQFAQRERERISARRFLQPEYGAQWERVGNRWLRAMHSTDGTISKEFLRLIRRETHCAYCGEYTKAKHRHLDHVWPLRHKGLHSADNLVMACSSCNRKKKDTMPLQWLMKNLSGPTLDCKPRVVGTTMFC
jgi:5-methylcytosine-specific restriction endonuclease McrA